MSVSPKDTHEYDQAAAEADIELNRLVNAARMMIAERVHELDIATTLYMILLTGPERHPALLTALLTRAILKLSRSDESI